jgi:hypothetical protein
MTPAERRRRWRIATPYLDALAAGKPVKAAARAARRDAATFYRWRQADPDLDAAFRQAKAAGKLARPAPSRDYVARSFSDECPRCGGTLSLRTGRGSRFWYCTEGCGYASWRARAFGTCACGGYRLWSHSLLSVSCETCGKRSPVRFARSLDDLIRELEAIGRACRAS